MGRRPLGICVTTAAVLIFLSLGMSCSAAADDDCIALSVDFKIDCSTRDEDYLQGKRTLWWDYKQGKVYGAMCCKPGSEGEKQKLAESPPCQTSDCVASSASLCPYRKMTDGSKIDYEEVIRDNCVTASGAAGFVAQCCPRNSTEGMLLSTMGAELHEFPHQVGVSSSGNCGGTIYNRNHVLTAAHCVVSKGTGQVKKPEDFTIQAGTSLGGYSGFDSQGTKYTVEEVLVHDNYSKLYNKAEFAKGDYGTTYNDIALLRIKGEFRFSDKVKALELAPEGFVPDQYAPLAILAGWGTTDTLQSSAHLQKVNVKIHRDQDCFQYNYGQWKPGPYSHYTQFQDQFLCVGGIFNKEWGAMAGSGDSGGPAICRGPTGNPVLCGVTSFGTDDAGCLEHKTDSTCKPSVYAEVEHFRRNWELLKKAGPQDPATLFRYKLYGDDELPANKYTHQVHITSPTSRPCGGTLVRKNKVLTAGQCVYGFGPDGNPAFRHDIKVTTGIRDINRPNSGRVIGVKDVDAYASRPGPPVNISAQYNPKKDFSRIIMTDAFYKNDLAILTLEEDVDIDESLLPKLPDWSYTPTGPATELSFPRETKYGGKLRAREFKFVPKDNCQSRLSRLSRLGVKSQLDDGVICAVETYSGGSTCDRELGGGLICKGDRGEEILCGIQIFRLCEFSIPNGFIDLAYFSGTIEGKL